MIVYATMEGVVECRERIAIEPCNTRALEAVMAMASVNIQLPQEIYHRLETAATHLGKPIDAVLRNTLDAALPTQDVIPADIQDEISRLDALDAQELQKIVQEEMSSAVNKLWSSCSTCRACVHLRMRKQCS